MGKNDIKIKSAYTNIVDEANKSDYKYSELEMDSKWYNPKTSKYEILNPGKTGGLGKYNKDKTDGSKFTSSNLTLKYETVEPDYDLSESFSIDYYDNHDTDGIVFGKGADKVIDELIGQKNAMTTSAICKKAGKVIEEDITTEAEICESIRKGHIHMTNKKVRPKSRILYITADLKDMIDHMDLYKSQSFYNKFDKVYEMIPDEFMTNIHVNDGLQEKYGYEPTVDSRYVNYIILERGAVVVGSDDRVFVATPDENGRLNGDDSASWGIRSRGCSGFVYDEKVDNIYTSIGTRNVLDILAEAEAGVEVQAAAKTTK